MSAHVFLNEITSLVARIHEGQSQHICAAAEIAADSIASGRMVHLFGAGHSALPVMEVFPRVGSFVGWHPLLELPLSFNAQVVGQMGMRQMGFLERTTGFAEVILANYAFDPRDCMIVFSHSGINALPVEMAVGARQRQMKVIAVMSLEHCRNQEARHPAGRLCDHADVVIDNCCPNGDALVEIPRLASKVGSGSTIAALTIVDALMSETADLLVKRGVDLVMYPNHNIGVDAEQEDSAIRQEEKVLQAYRQLVAKV